MEEYTYQVTQSVNMACVPVHVAFSDPSSQYTMIGFVALSHRQLANDLDLA